MELQTLSSPHHLRSAPTTNNTSHAQQYQTQIKQPNLLKHEALRLRFRAPRSHRPVGTRVLGRLRDRVRQRPWHGMLHLLPQPGQVHRTLLGLRKLSRENIRTDKTVLCLFLGEGRSSQRVRMRASDAAQLSAILR